MCPHLQAMDLDKNIHNNKWSTMPEHFIKTRCFRPRRWNNNNKTSGSMHGYTYVQQNDKTGHVPASMPQEFNRIHGIHEQRLHGCHLRGKAWEVVGVSHSVTDKVCKTADATFKGSPSIALVQCTQITWHLASSQKGPTAGLLLSYGAQGQLPVCARSNTSCHQHHSLCEQNPVSQANGLLGHPWQWALQVKGGSDTHRRRLQNEPQLPRWCLRTGCRQLPRTG